MLAAFPAWAAAAPKEPALKIGVIDTGRILRESKAAKSASATFQKELEAKRAILAAKDKELRLLDAELKNPDSKLTADARKNETDKLAQEVKEFKRMQTDLDEELKKRDSELTRKLIDEIRQVIRTLVKNENFTLILEKGSVVHADDAINITDKVIKLYDSQKK
jgi:outer membrane protein